MFSCAETMIKLFSSLIVKDGVFSFLKGDSPINSLPLFFNFTVFPTTCETFNLNLISSKIFFWVFHSQFKSPLIFYSLLKNLKYQHVLILEHP